MLRKLFATVIALAAAAVLVVAFAGNLDLPGLGDGGHPRSYTVQRVEGDIDWDGVPQLDIDQAQWLDPAGITAHAQLCYDDDALHVRMWAEEEHVRAEYQRTDPFPKCYEDSCLEFFIAPMAGDDRYMNLEFNPNCAVCSEIGTQKSGRVRLIPTDDVFRASSSYTADGWEIVYELPFEYIRTFYPGFSAGPGVQVRGNFYKCGNLTEHKHYLSWNPVDSDTPNFHVPASFGVLVFG